MSLFIGIAIRSAINSRRGCFDLLMKCRYPGTQTPERTPHNPCVQTQPYVTVGNKVKAAKKTSHLCLFLLTSLTPGRRKLEQAQPGDVSHLPALL